MMFTRCWTTTRRVMTSRGVQAMTSRREVKVYTRTGDAGDSSLFTGERRHKSDPIFDALGDCDELNSFVGVARHSLADSTAHAQLDAVDATLERAQSALLDVGSAVATPVTSSMTSEKRVARVKFESDALVRDLEDAIDVMTSQLPPLRNFILPGGGRTASDLHVCRSVCRRLERHLVAAHDDTDARKFVNRLSDYFFTAARFAAMVENRDEVTYKKPKS